MKTTIDMAREAGFDIEQGALLRIYLDHFAELVRADERKSIQAESEADKVIIEYHEATIKRLEAAILAEREACAKVCEEYADDVRTGVTCAKAIRARGKT